MTAPRPNSRQTPKRTPIRFVRELVALVLLMFVAPVCSDIFAPKTGLNGIVTITYMGPPVKVNGIVKLTIGDTLRPSVQVTVGGLPQPRARYFFTSTNTKIVKADSGFLRVVGRGTDTVVASVAGVTIDSASSAKTRDTIIVFAVPANDSVISPTKRDSLVAIGDTLTLVGFSLGSDKARVGLAPPPNDTLTVRWFSSDTTIATVDVKGIFTPADTSVSAVVTAIRPGGSVDIITVFDQIDSVRTHLRVTQVLSRYVFSVSGSPSTGIAFSSLGDTAKITATAQDSKNVPLLTQPAATFQSNKASAVTIDPLTGVAKAVLNTDGDSARISITGRPTTEYLPIDVKQIATSIAINGTRTVAIAAPGTDTTLSALAKDARQNPMSSTGHSWASTDQSVAQVDDKLGKVSTFAVGSSKISVRRDGATDTVTVVVTNNPKTVVVSPKPMAIRSVTDTARAAAVASNAKGNVIPGAPVTWSSLNPAIATVGATTGLVTGIAVGNTSIVGLTTAGGAADTLTVNVTNNPTVVNIIPASATMASINDTITAISGTPPGPTNFAVDFRNSKGASLPTTSVKWTSETPAVVRVTIDGTGTVIAVSAGEARIFAENADGSVKDTLNVTVTNAPAVVTLNRTNDTLSAPTRTLQYTADAVNARGALIPGTPITWRSTNGGIASISSQGLATGLAVGQTLIIGETGAGTFATGLRADTAVLVVINSAVSMAVTPSTGSIPSLGSTLQLSASATNAVGGDVPGLTFIWTSSVPAVATVSSTGLVTGVAVGTTVITATVGTLSSTSTITVTNAPTTIDIAPTLITLASVNDQNTPALTIQNASGTTLPRTAANWSSDDPLIATVTSDGIITAVAPGNTKIRAVSPINAAIKDSVSVGVSNAPATITLSPSTAQTLTAIGGTLTITATVLNANSNPISNPTVTWSVLPDSTVVTAVTSGVATGLVTAVSNGTSITVRATSGTVHTDVMVTVAQTVSPSQTTIVASPTSIVADGLTTSGITVQLRDANGNNFVAAPPVVSLTTSLGALSAVTNAGSGRFTATLTTGTVSGGATVAGTAGAVGISTNALVTFTPGAATQYLVTSTNSTPIAGSSVTINAQLTDVNGNHVATAAKTVTWSSSNGGSFGAPTSPTNASGVATATFTTATSSTTHFVTATDNTALAGTTPAITTTAGAATKYLVTVSSTSPVAGTGVTVTAQLADVNGVSVGTAGQVVTWSGGAGGSFGSPTSTTNSLGVTTVTFTASATAGAATTVIGTDAATRTGTSPTITTIPGAVSAAKTTIVVGTTPITSPGTSTVTVQAKDANSPANNITVTSGVVTLAATLGTLGTVTDNGNGTYTATLTTSATGSGSISGTIGGAPITSGNPAFTVIPGAISTTTSTITMGVSTLTANGVSNTVATLHARDAQGNNLTASSGATVVITTTAGVISGQADPNNGTYTATLTAPISAGSATVSATINATQIAVANRATVNFVADVPSGATSTITIVPPTPASVAVGTAVPITVRLKDANTNNLAVGGATVVISRTGAGSLTTVTDNGNGTYTATLSSAVVGSTTISATVGGAPISTGNPTVAFVADAASQIAVNGGDNQSAVAGTSVATLPSVLVRDANLNPVAAIAVTFAIGSGGGSLTGGSATTNGSGIATVGSWTLGAIGANTLTATSGGLSGSPVTFFATGTIGTASTAKTLITASPTTLTADQTSAITVQLRDANDNPLTTGGGTVTLSATAGTLSAVTNVGNGTYTATYTATTATTVTISGTLNGAGIVDVEVLTVNVGTATQYTINAGAGQSAVVSTTVATPPAVLVRDAEGNPIPSVNVRFDVTAGGGTINTGLTTVTVPTNSSGIAALASWTLGSSTTVSNTLTATVTTAALPITGTVLSFTGTGTPSAVSAANTTIAASPSTIAAGGTSTITVQAKDGSASANNRTTSSGTVTLSATIGSLSAVTDNGNGTYTATYTASAPGASATISGTIGGTPIGGGNATITITSTAATTAQSTVTGSTSIEANGTATTLITLQLKDAGGNNVVATTETITLETTGGTLLASLTTSGGGTYTQTLQAPATLGSATLTGKINTVAIATTATVNFVPGAASTATSTLTPSAASITAGGSVTITVQLKDATSHNLTTSGGTVTLSTTLGSLTTVVNNNNGTYTAVLTSTTAGTATATGTVGGSPVTDDAVVTVNAGAAAAILVNAGNSQTAPAGTVVPTPPSVVIRDANGNPVSGVNVTFSVAANNGLINGNTIDVVVPSATTTGIAALASWTLHTSAATNTLTATATLGGTPTAVTFTATGTVGTASTTTTLITATPTSLTADQTSAIVIQLKDAAGNNLTSSVGTVVLSTTRGTLSAVAAGPGGTGTFTATFTATTVGTARITGTLNGSGIIDFEDLTITAGTATQYTINAGAGQSAVVSTTVATPPAVLVRDAEGNPIQSVAIDFAVTAGGGTINTGLTTVTVPTNSSGIAALTSWTLGSSTTVSNTLTATVSTAALPITGTVLSFTGTGTPSAVSAANTTIGASPSTIAAGGTSTITVQAKDGSASANNRTTSSGTVTLSATIGSLSAVTDVGNGTYTATYTASALGTSATISGTIGGTPIGGGNATITINSGAPTTAQSTVTAGSPTLTANGTATTLITLQLKDAGGNNVVAGGATITLETTGGTLVGGPGGLTTSGGGTYTQTLQAPATLGSATLTGKINTVAIATTATVTFVAGTATKYVITTPTTPITAAARSTVLVTAQLADVNGNPVTTSGKTVLWTNTGARGSFATPTSLTDANGQAAVSFTVDTLAGTVHTVRATDNTALTGPSGNITVVAAAPSQLVFVTNPPTSLAANASFGATVEVRDQFANPVLADPTGASEEITVALTTPGGATLGGTKTLTVDWSNGRAAFTGLTVDRIGSYTLTATDANFATNLTDATSASFSVTGTANLSVTTQGAEAGPTNIVYTVTLSAPNNTGAPITVEIDDAGTGTATSGLDYTAIAGNAQVTIANGASTGTLTVVVLNDALLELTETVNATISGPSNVLVSIGTASASANITSEELATVSIATLQSGAESPNAPIIFRVSLSLPNNTGAPITVALTDPFSGTATSGADYTAFAQTVTIANGDSFTDVSVPVTNDGLLELTETVNAAISTPSPSSIVSLGTATTSADITSEELATVSVATLQQGNEAGTVPIKFRVSLSLPNNTGAPITVALTDPFSGTATSGADYTAFAQTVAIANGDSFTDVTVAVANDALLEPQETVNATISSPNPSSIVSLGTSSTSATIDESGATVSVSTQQNGAESPNAPIIFRVALSKQNVTGADVTVILADAGTGTATSGADYTAFGGTVTIPTGNTFTDVSVPVTNDGLLELTETVNATISSPNPSSIVSLGTASTSANIESEELASVSITTQQQGNEAGTVPIKFRVSLSLPNNTGAPITVVLTDPFSGTATSGADYTAFAQTVTIVNGDSFTDVTVAVANDALLEPQETVNATISSPNPSSIVSLGTSSTSATIDESGATVSVSTQQNGAESPNAPIIFRVALSKQNVTGADVTVTLADAGTGTAMSGLDYTAFGGTVTIPTGNTFTDVSVPVTNDGLLELTETVNATISSPSSTAAVSLGTASTSADITSEELATVSIATLQQGNEAGTVPIKFRVSLSLPNNTGAPITVVLTDPFSGTATSGADYTAFAQTVTIADGDSFTDVSVAVTDDALLEPQETVNATISSPNPSSIVSLGTSSTSATIDESGATANLSATDGAEPGSNIVFHVTLMYGGNPKTNMTGGDVTVTIADAGTGTATPTPSLTPDYTAFGGTVTISNTNSSGDFTVTVLDDALVEGTETVDATISSPNLASVTLGTASFTANILDDDILGHETMTRVESVATVDEGHQEDGATVTLDSLQVWVGRKRVEGSQFGIV